MVTTLPRRPSRPPGLRPVALLVVAPLAVTAPAHLVAQGWERSPAWSTAQVVAFVGNRDGDVDIYAVGADGTGSRNLTRSDGLDVGPAWSPDGSMIAFLSERTGRRALWVMDADGSNARPVTSRGDIVFSRPSWSPDGGRVLYVAGPHAGADLWILDLSSGESIRLTDDDALNGYPHWSPDGRQVVFVSNRAGGNLDVYRMDIDGSNPVRLTTDPAEEGQPVWSPDGRTIAFFSGRGSNRDIYLMDAGGERLRRLTRHAASDVSPAWSPDGRRIVFSSDREGQARLFVMPAEGGEARPLIGSGLGLRLRPYPASDLAGDLEVARRALEEAHPGLHRYASASQTDAAFTRARSAVRDGMTELEFLGVVRTAVAVARDGHTRVAPSRALDSLLAATPYVIPLVLQVREEAVYVRESHAPFGPEPGDRVLRVNGDDVRDVVARLTAAHPGDGAIRTGKLARLGRPLVFSDYYLSQVKPVVRYTVGVAPRDGGPPREHVLEGLTPVEFRSRSGTGTHGQPSAVPPVEFAMRDAVAVLTIRSFGRPTHEAAGIDFPAMLERTFGRLRRGGVKGLVLDVRGNGGGTDENGRLLASYLMREPFRYYDRLEMKAASYPFLASLGTTLPNVPAERLRPDGRGGFRLLGHSNLGWHEPAAAAFDGPVVVLLDGGSFSATSEFLTVLHDAGRAVFVGEEGGGGYYGNTSGMGATVVLPATGLRLRIPLVSYWMAVSGEHSPDRGLVPDHRVTSSIEDVVTGRDRPLEFALDLLARNQGGMP